LNFSDDYTTTGENKRALLLRGNDLSLSLSGRANGHTKARSSFV
jgi:hypothetical protein